MNRNIRLQIAFAAAGFMLGYVSFALLIPGEMVLHRMGGALIMGVVGAVLGSMAVDLIFDQQQSRALRS